MDNSSNADRYVTFTDDSGREVQFEFLDLINYEDEGYVVLLPSDSDGTVVILKVTGDNEYESEEDEEVMQAVFEIFKENHPELEFEEEK